MDEISKSVAQSIKTGQYFRDARKWYTEKYLYPLTERSLLVLVFAITSVAFLVVIYNFNALFPLKREIPFVIKVDDSLNYYSTIHPLLKGGEQPEDAITRYLLNSYVHAYETYDFDEMARNEAIIRGNSTKRVFKTYTNFMSASNPESPLLLYQRTATKTVKILSTTLFADNSEVKKATVTFTTTLNDRLQHKTDTNRFQTEITFLMSDIKKVAEHKEPLEFVVTDYQVRPIK